MKNLVVSKLDSTQIKTGYNIHSKIDLKIFEKHLKHMNCKRTTQTTTICFWKRKQSKNKRKISDKKGVEHEKGLC